MRGGPEVLLAARRSSRVPGLRGRGGRVAEKGYDAGDLPADAKGRVRWGVAFCGKRVAVACERVG